MDTKKVTKLITKEIIDKNTGEIINAEQYSESVVEREPDYIKIYLNHLCIFNGLKLGSNRVLLELCNYISLPSENSTHQYLIISIFIKENIAKKLNLSVSRINQAIGELVNAGMLTRIKNERTGRYMNNTYIVNPYIIARGRWSDIKKFRATFDYINNTIETDIE